MDPRVDQLRHDLALFARGIRGHREGHQLTASQLQVLGLLDAYGPLNARDLAARERVAPQSMAKTVKSLEAASLVTRCLDPADARAFLIEITDEGRTTLVNDRVVRNRWLEAALAERCTEAEREVLYIAGRLLRSLSESPVRADARAEADTRG
ncbi:MarR family winged helix-turn-helix transcriptional regulator [Cryptosporangium aurantiacum]|uniref:DNA-binding transcriptional regulator, MarR family n=1 Tax=Cryptosporangium aurantiacum TaxID=134849 RepID=A0A1M7R3J4_9ACTN|nr:MarR family transcriptional regulator [Cryptosporangium aurantiacum]SHN39541.1 DNA-binding transcriptional regulator, MarR family [Cryptosporangium aurantiacum]